MQGANGAICRWSSGVGPWGYGSRKQTKAASGMEQKLLWHPLRCDNTVFQSWPVACAIGVPGVFSLKQRATRTCCTVWVSIGCLKKGGRIGTLLPYCFEYFHTVSRLVLAGGCKLSTQNSRGLRFRSSISEWQQLSNLFSLVVLEVSDFSVLLRFVHPLLLVLGWALTLIVGGVSLYSSPLVIYVSSRIDAVDMSAISV